jgi:hypothetical protein
VASQMIAPAARTVPIVKPILKSFCISPTTNGRKRALIPFPPGS